MAPETPWISVGELADAFAPDNHALPASGDLSGRVVTLSFEDGSAVEFHFAGSRLTWKATAGERRGEGSEEAYRATRVREGIYFVDYLLHQERASSVSLVLDLNAGVATALLGRLPTEEEARTPLLDRIARGEDLTGVTATFLAGAVDRPFAPETSRHDPTGDLVGRRVEYTYSATERYEHVYLNPDFYTWHCLAGSEKGLADTDRCHYLRLAQDLYLFVWREKIVPTLGVVVVDFRALKTTGKIFGYEQGNFERLVNFPIGAYARVLNVTREGAT